MHFNEQWDWTARGNRLRNSIAQQNDTGQGCIVHARHRMNWRWKLATIPDCVSLQTHQFRQTEQNYASDYEKFGANKIFIRSAEIPSS